jgi:hypothetical protein
MRDSNVQNIWTMIDTEYKDSLFQVILVEFHFMNPIAPFLNWIPIDHPA